LIQELDNERKLIEECKKGNINAFEAIYRHFQQPLYSYAMRVLEQRDDAEDAIQMTFLKLYRGIKKFKYNAKFSTYLFRILINVCYDIIAKRKYHESEDLHALKITNDQSNDMHLHLDKSIKNLPQRMRECFILYAVEGFPQGEIANMMQLSIGSVKAHVFQAKQKLRTQLSDYFDEVQDDM